MTKIESETEKKYTKILQEFKKLFGKTIVIFGGKLPSLQNKIVKKIFLKV